jgi:acyl-CoA reductase-like NAD-dependent aldehyde dehydrogenase
LRNDGGVVNSSLMDRLTEQSAEELQSALHAARENENRWVGMSPERIEALLARLSSQYVTKQ